ncbi:mitochondrion protein, partial [Magnaporthiopsis poae ATCC 64411]
MLRTSLRSVRGAGGRSFAAVASRQWQVGAAGPARVAVKRHFADLKTPEPAVMPPSETRTAAASQSPPPTSQTRVQASQIQPENVPLTPPAASVPSPKKKKGFFRRLRNYILTMTVLGSLAFGGGVWYSRINDSFHDFFTGFVPYGEQAVLYLEEMDFRKRFPRIANRGGSSNAKDSDASVRIPAQSGASWRVADTEPPVKRESSAVKEAKAAKAKASPKEEPVPEAKKPAPVKKPTASAKAKPSQVAAPAPPAASAAGPAPAAVAAFTPPEVDEPSRWPPASPIDPLAVNDANEPVVQDLVKLINDIITVVNADGANERYGPTIGKAKQAADQLGSKIREMKKAAQDEAAVTIKEQIDRLETHAADLIARIEGHMAAQETRWREEFEAEMARTQEMFDARLKTMTERERKIAEAKLQNRLMEQALELQRQFKEEIKQRVEAERDGRLGQLESLTTAVSELDQLTSSLDEVVD